MATLLKKGLNELDAKQWKDSINKHNFLHSISTTATIEKKGKKYSIYLISGIVPIRSSFK